ncbi:MAG: ATP-binding cassette domain-containing protein [Sciscionella sp.]
MTETMIRTDAVSKKFGAVLALQDVSVAVPSGSVLALLGHNGAGKTTLVNVLTTVLPPSSGTAQVAGFDVVSQGKQVRSRIGLTGQFAAVDEQLSGTDNLILIARLLGASKLQARSRATELLGMFDLEGAAKRAAKTYSGGMRRRLDLAASLVGQPEVVFLDEPTSGLDPVSRLALWDIVRRLVDGGTTVLLTTQYLDEADRLADSIAVLSAGKVVASGTPAELKAQVGSRTVNVTLERDADSELARSCLHTAGFRPSGDTGRTLIIPVERSAELAPIVRTLDEVGIDVAELALGEPSLDDVYMSMAATPAA